MKNLVKKYTSAGLLVLLWLLALPEYVVAQGAPQGEFYVKVSILELSSSSTRNIGDGSGGDVDISWVFNNIELDYGFNRQGRERKKLYGFECFHSGYLPFDTYYGVAYSEANLDAMQLPDGYGDQIVVEDRIRFPQEEGFDYNTKPVLRFLFDCFENDRDDNCYFNSGNIFKNNDDHHAVKLIEHTIKEGQNIIEIEAREGSEGYGPAFYQAKLLVEAYFQPLEPFLVYATADGNPANTTVCEGQEYYLEANYLAPGFHPRAEDDLRVDFLEYYDSLASAWKRLNTLNWNIEGITLHRNDEKGFSFKIPAAYPPRNFRFHLNPNFGAALGNHQDFYIYSPTREDGTPLLNVIPTPPDELTLETPYVCTGEKNIVNIMDVPGARVGEKFQFTLQKKQVGPDGTVSWPLFLAAGNPNRTATYAGFGAGQMARFSNLPDGEYRIAVSKFANDGAVALGQCTYFEYLNLQAVPFPEYEVETRNVTCTGETGYVHVELNFRQHPFTIKATDTQTGEVFESPSDSYSYLPLPIGTYSVEVLNYAGCSTAHPELIEIRMTDDSQMDIISLNRFEHEGTFYDAACSGELAQLSILPQNAPAPYFLRWEVDGAFGGNRSYTAGEEIYLELGSGNYTFFLSSTATCIGTVDLEINIPEAPLSVGPTTITNASACTSDGQISLGAVSGGLPPYQFSLDGQPPVANGTFPNLYGGYHLIDVTDALGCSLRTVHYIETGESMQIDTVMVNDLSCAGSTAGSLDIRMTGGVPPYQYQLNDGAFVDQQIFDNLDAGLYKVRVRDAAGCEQITFVTLKEPSAVSVKEIRVVEPPVCQGGPAQIAVLVGGGNGGNTFSIDGSPFAAPDTQLIYARIYGITPGNHNLQVRDKNGCLSEVSGFSVADPEVLALSVGTVKDVSCRGEADGNVRLNPSGGYFPYTITVHRDGNPVDTIQAVYTNALIVSSLSPGAYQFELRDGRSCTAELSDMVSVGEPAVLSAVADNTGEDIIPCGGASNGTITVTATGGVAPYEYAVNNGNFQDSPELGNAMPNNAFYVRDSRGCTFSDSISIPLGPLMTGEVLETRPITNCASGAARLNIKNFRGDLRITVERSTPTSPCAGILHVKGEEEEAEKSGTYSKADSRFTYLIKNNSFSTDTTFWVEGISGGPQCITIEDASGCRTFESASVGFAALNVGTTTTTDVSCISAQDGTATLSLSGSTAFTVIVDLTDTLMFTAPNFFAAIEAGLSGLSAGPHSVVVKGAYGCIRTGEFTIGNASEFTPIVDQTNMQGCGLADYQADVAISFSVGTAPFTVSWPDDTPGSQNENGTQRFGLPPNEYEVLVSDANGCQDSVVFYIEPVDTFSVSVISSSAPDCLSELGAVQLSASGGTGPYSYTLDFVNFQAEGNFDSLAAGNYLAKAVDAGGCEEFISFEINPFQAEYFSVIPIPVSCAGMADGGIRIETSVSGGYQYMLNGQFINAGDTIKGLAAGTYDLSILNEGSCELVFNGLVVTEPEPLTANTTLLSPSICGQFNAIALAEASGGTGPYQYQWNFQLPAALDTAYSLPPGANRLIVTDARSCRDTQVVSITSSARLDIFPTVNAASCGEDNGQITLNITGGQAPMDITWNDPTINGLNAADLTPGLYEVAVADVNGCRATKAITVGVEEPTRVELVALSPQICDTQLGSIQVQAFGGDGSYTYQWSHEGEPGDAVAEGLTAGTYTLTLTDGSGCAAVFTETVDFTSGPTVTVAETGLTDCEQPTGSISVDVTDGTLPYTYSWDHDGALSGNLAEALTAGMYRLTVTDKNGCQSSVEATVGTANGPSVSLQSVADSPCTGAEGSISIGGTGGTLPYGYSWSHDPLLNAPTADALEPGMYTVTLTDFRGCTASVNATVLPTGGPTITVDSISNSLCTEGTGYLRVSVSNGNAPFDFEWDLPEAANSPTLQDLSSGLYQLTLTDSDGCIGTFSQEISLETGPVLSLLEKDSSFCDDPNGRLRVAATGNGPIAYSWSHDGQLSLPEASGLLTGSYTVTATDANGCTDVLTEIIPDLPPPVLTRLTTEHNSCGEQIGSISFELADGSSPYFISWSHDAELAELTANNLNGGIYQISVEDSNGCLVIDTTEILNENGPEAILQITNSLCTDGTGSIAVAVTGGAAPFTYTWSDGTTGNDPQLSDLTAGTYTVTITDRGLCQTEVSGTVMLEDGPVIQVADTRNTFCEEGNGSIRLQATGTGPFTYRWAHDPDLNLNLADALDAGIYTVNVSDANHCEVTIQEEITLIAGPVVAIDTVNPSFCDLNNGSILLDVSGGDGAYTYAWSHDATLNADLAEGLAPNNYQITVTDGNNCRITVDTTVMTHASPTIDILRTQGSTCAAANGEIEVAARGGLGPYTYAWPFDPVQADSIVTGLSGGTYRVVVTDSRGCTVQQQITIDNTDGPNVALSTLKNSFCTNDNGMIELQTEGGTGPYSYTWSHDGSLDVGTASDLPAGDYEILVADANNCTVNLSYSLEFEPGPMLEIQSAEDSNCGPNNGRIQINPISDAMVGISWSHDPELSETIAEALPAGTYTITLTDANACTESFNIILEGTDSLQIDSLTLDQPSCNGSDDGLIAVEISGGDGNYQISWNHDASLQGTTASMLPSGTYQVAVEDGVGCRATGNFSLANVTPLTAAGQLQPPNCFGAADGSIVVTAGGGNGHYTYQWNVTDAPDNDTLQNLSAGIYQLTLTDEKGCTLNSEFALSEQTTAVRISLVDNSVVQPPCAGDTSGSFSVLASGGVGEYTYLWSNDATTAALEQIPSGIFELTVTDANGCTAQFSYELEPTGALSTDLVFADATICEGSGLTLDYSSEDYDFLWSGPNGFSSAAKRIELSQAGTYSVRISSGNCILEESFQIQIDPQPFQTLFIVPTEVVAGDTIVAYEVSWPTPDVMTWQYDQDSVQYLGQDQNQHFFHFPYPGDFEIGLEAGLNTCSDLLQKTIRVVADSSQLDIPLDPGTREFSSIRLSPNPNSGVFEVNIEMTRAIDVELRIFNALSEIQATQSGAGQQSYRFNFAEDLVPGAYLLFVKGEQEQRVLTFVVI